MHLTWVLYILALTALAGAAALWGESILRRFRRSTRWVWAGALIVSSGGSLAVLLFPARSDDLTFGLADLLAGTEGFLHAAVVEVRTVQWSLARQLPDLSTALNVAWAAALLGAVVWLAHGYCTLRRRRRRWEKGEVAGRECLISRRTGPAVVGVLRPRLVLPGWIADLPAEQREMVLRHEEEHLDRRDPWLLAVAYGALLLLPWNPVLWWQLRRLRLAVEMDCDRRVAERYPNRAGYGELLLELGRKGPPAPVAAFAAGESHTGERIRELMRSDTSGSPALPLRAAGALLAVSLLVLTPRPIIPYRSERPPESMQEIDPTPFDEPPRCLNCDAVDDYLARELTSARRRTGRRHVLVGIQVTGRGEVRHVAFGRDQELPADSLNERVRRAARSLRFSPARLKGDTVTVWLYHPFPLEEEARGE